MCRGGTRVMKGKCMSQADCGHVGRWRARAAALTVAAGLLLIAAPAVAAPVNFSFTGTSQEGFGSLASGAVLTGSFGYELGQPDQTPANANVGSYQISSFSLSAGGGTITDSASPLLTVFNGTVDLFELRLFGLAGSLGGLGVDQALIRLLDPTGLAFASDALPAQLDLTDFSQRPSLSLLGSFAPFVEAHFTLTALTLIPPVAQISVAEPASLMLFGLAFGGLALGRRRA
jgi:hypothetical protein